VQVERVEENQEEGTRYAMLIYPEGEVAVKVEQLPGEISGGAQLAYQPSSRRFRAKKSGSRNHENTRNKAGNSPALLRVVSCVFVVPLVASVPFLSGLI